jgi:hypothetical protein
MIELFLMSTYSILVGKPYDVYQKTKLVVDIYLTDNPVPAGEGKGRKIQTNGAEMDIRKRFVFPDERARKPPPKVEGISRLLHAVENFTLS